VRAAGRVRSAERERETCAIACCLRARGEGVFGEKIEKRQKLDESVKEKERKFSILARPSKNTFLHSPNDLLLLSLLYPPPRASPFSLKKMQTALRISASPALVGARAPARKPATVGLEEGEDEDKEKRLDISVSS
jgi:hypothetical protein